MAIGSRIFQAGADGKNLSKEYVIWQERTVDEPHNRSRDIMGMSIKEPNVWTF